MSYIIVFFISMVPLIELRGAIPYAIAQGLPYVPSYIIAILGNMLPVPFIYLFARKVLLWGADKPESSSPTVSRKVKKAERNFRRPQEKACL